MSGRFNSFGGFTRSIGASSSTSDALDRVGLPGGGTTKSSTRLQSGTVTALDSGGARSSIRKASKRAAREESSSFGGTHESSSANIPLRLFLICFGLLVIGIGVKLGNFSLSSAPAVLEELKTKTKLEPLRPRERTP